MKLCFALRRILASITRSKSASVPRCHFSSCSVSCGSGHCATSSPLPQDKARCFLSTRTEIQGHESILHRTVQLIDAKSHDVNDTEMWKEAEEVLQLWLQAPKPSELERIEYCIRLLDRLSEILPQGEVLFGSMFDTGLLNEILLQWRNAVARMVQGRLQRQLSPSFMAEKVDKYRWSSLVQPDAKTFNLILDGASFYPHKEGVLFADSLLKKLVQVSTETANLNLVDTVSFGSVMNAWVRSRKPQKAEDWLRRMQDLHQGPSWDQVQPNSIIYTTVISGWAKVGDALRAEAILQEQLQDYDKGNEMSQPDSQTFNAVLDALANFKHKDAPQKAEAILTQMKDLWGRGLDCAPDEYSFTNLTRCYANQSPEKAERVLQELANAASTGDASILPTVVAYNAVLHAYAQMGKAEQADSLLQRLFNSQMVAPDEISFNTTIAAWSKSKSPDAALNAEALLAAMQDCSLQPSVVSYSTVMQTWAKSKTPGAAERTEELLREMQSQYEAGNSRVQPSIISYNIVLNAWCNMARNFRETHAVGRATRLLDEILQNSTLKPTHATFQAVLHAIAGSAVHNKFERVQVVMQLMERHGIQPNSNDNKLISRLAKAKAKAKAKKKGN